MLVKLAAIFFSTILVNNYVLVKFYGICPFLGVSKSWTPPSVCPALLSSSCWSQRQLPSRCGSSFWTRLGLSYLQTIVFILVIAVLVQFIGIFPEEVCRCPVQPSLGVYLPLITTQLLRAGRHHSGR